MMKSVELPTFDFGNSIPKNIFQTYVDSESLPDKLKENIANIQALNPEWQYKLYNDFEIESFILEYYGAEILKVYNKINPAYGAARADFFRYLLLYARGGVYLDIKSTITLPLNDVIQNEDRYILSHWEEPVMHPEFETFPILKNGGGEYQQWHIITAKGHPFLRKVIEGVIDNIQNYHISRNGIGRKGVIKTTGPVVYTVEIEKLRSSYPYRIVDIKNDFGIIYSIYKTSSEVHDSNHEHIFKKHYSKLITPIVLPETIWSYLYMFFFYFIGSPKFLRKKIKSEFPTLYSRLHP